ncbi:calcium-binding protein (plasmid) [Sinorhizobium meliloti]|nr:calcium-binding protein [Sinorhizobium meliloti]
MARIVGTSADDTLDGMAEGDRIWSLDGNDVVDGGAGDDFVDGGAGDDALTSSSGFDEFTGGEGNDRLSFIGIGGAARGRHGGRHACGRLRRNIRCLPVRWNAWPRSLRRFVG